MKKFYKHGTVLILIVIISILTQCFAAFAVNSHVINTPYDYPIKPGTAAWEELKTHDEMVAACRIPENILEKMSTEALTETVLNYPLLVDMFAMPTPYSGYEGTYILFNGLQELAGRKDAITVLNNYIAKTNTLTSSTNMGDELKLFYRDLLIDGMLISSYNEFQSDSNTVVPYYTLSYVYTPNGTAVLARYNTTWSDIEFSEAQLITAQADMDITYPEATRLRGYNIKYNCHSYAWHSTSSNNLYWIDDPSYYMTDGSYTASPAVVGAKVFYDSAYGTQYDHSAIANNTPAIGSFTVTSKWGMLGLYSHSLMYCPYSSYSPHCTFYVR